MMKQFLKIAVITGALALAAAPAFAANPHEGEPPYGHGSATGTHIQKVRAAKGC